ncbi:unnamed protein product [Citrullus colocynthis]|uniref:Uncharacterized protein n=1 Tax=Citrullus colocynthis TaxID=252529 RepID=A0ABP0XVS3_9ROSI
MNSADESLEISPPFLICFNSPCRNSNWVGVLMADDESRSIFDWENFPLQRKIESKEWSMVVIRDSLPDDDFSVFPPSKHENLQPPSIEEDERGSPVSFQSNSPSSLFSSSQSSSSFSSFSFSDDEISHPHSPKPSDCQIRKSITASRWLLFGVQILRSRITAMARRTAFWLFSPAGRIALLMTLLWLYKRARKRRLRQSTEELKMMIEEKDEKISQLLQQVAQLNRSLLLAQRKVLPSNWKMKQDGSV